MSFEEMLEVEKLSVELMDNETSREIFDYLSQQETIGNMIRAVENDRPPFEAVVEEIEAICSHDGSTLNVRKANNMEGGYNTSFAR